LTKTQSALHHVKILTNMFSQRQGAFSPVEIFLPFSLIQNISSYHGMFT